MSKVELAIYDLSQGMARGLSAQFLGPSFEIPAIPHTGIVVYGREYFFGGGIQSEDPHAFRQTKGLHPMETIELGHTSIPKETFDRWCQMMMTSGRFSPDSYDLLTRNCNNFCHEALPTLGIPQSAFPRWILEVPQKFLSSPMGQMVRPMLENMQITAPVQATNPTTISNPWANGATAPVNPWTSKERTFPTLEALKKPLLSNETKTLHVCIAKITATFPEANELLTRFEADMAKGQSIELSYQEALCEMMIRVLESAQQLTFALLLARTVVLHCSSQSTLGILEWIRDHLGSLTGNARSVAWLVVGNIVAHQNKVDDWVLDTAIADMSAGEVPVRQAVGAVLYNCTLVLVDNEEHLKDSTVSILCILLEDEKDETTLERRLMAAGKWLFENEAARNLARELDLAGQLSGSTSKLLADEIIALLQD